jgi:N-acyl homoserine lactone hydrolase
MGKKYEIIPMPLCYNQIDKSFMTYFVDCGTPIRVPIFSFYIKGAEKNILVDTGCPAWILDKYLHPPSCSDIQSFEKALDKQDLKPGDIDMVIHTHLHLDHDGYTRQCTNAELIVQEDELKFAESPHPLWAAIYPKELTEGLNFQTVKGDNEIVDGIKVLFTPGHTPGTQSVAVATAKGTAIITGFCVIRENFEVAAEIQEIYPSWVVYTPGFHCDALAAFDSMVRVKELADILVPCHEPELEKTEKIP